MAKMSKREMKRRAKALAIGLAFVPAPAALSAGYFFSNVNDIKIERLEEEYQETNDQALLKQIDQAKNYSLAGKILLGIGGAGLVGEMIAMIALADKYKRRSLYADNSPLSEEKDEDCIIIIQNSDDIER